MLDFDRAPNTKAMYRKLTSAGHPFMREHGAKCNRDECCLKGLRIAELPVGLGEDALTALEDTRAFCRNALHCLWEGRGPLLVVSVDNAHSNTYSMDVTKDSVTIRASSSRGAARAFYRLQNLMRLRRADFVRTGHYESAMDFALAYPAFKRQGINDMDYPEAYNENYLRRIARAGYTGFHLNLGASLFFKSDILPEMNHPQAEDNFKTLQSIVEKANRCGLDVYLSPYLVPYPENHPVFVNHPGTRGSRSIWGNEFVLCTSSPEVHAFFDEQFRLLFRSVPGLGGVILISGCEGWLHCYTATDQVDGQRCECPNCKDTSAEKTVAEMFNVIAKAVKQTDPAARCIVWNYGIFAWSDIGAEKFVSALSPDCDVMANFDTGEDYVLEGARGTYFDYSLTCVGPSAPCLQQEKTARKGHHQFLVKCESGTSLEYCSLQYSPTVQRWYHKFSNIADLNVNGALFNWKFVGYTGGLTQELAGLIASGERTDILNRLAIREFGKDNLPLIRKAWQYFDKAVGHHPFSINSAGYFKGPFYIGPAQPLILNPECPPKPPSCYFFNPNSRTPMFMTTLQFVEPFGVKVFRKTMHKLLVLWEKGCEYLDRIEPHSEDKYLAERIAEHRALCNLFKTFFHTAINMVDFYELRDSFHNAPYSPEEAKNKLLQMAEIAKSELKNTREALAIVKKYPAITYSYTYHYGISTEMCEYKIKHTIQLLKNDLPHYYYTLTFTRNRYPELLKIDIKE